MLAPGRVVANVFQEGEDAFSAVNVIRPVYAGAIKTVCQGYEVEAGGLLAATAIRCNDGYRAGGCAIAIGSRNINRPITNDSLGLSRQGEQMVGKAWPVHGGKEMVGQDKAARVRPVVRNLLLRGSDIRIQAESGQVEAIHLAAVHRFESAVPCVTEGVLVRIGHGCKGYLGSGRDKTGGRAVGPWEVSKIIIEGMVFLQDEGRVLDRIWLPSSRTATNGEKQKQQW